MAFVTTTFNDILEIFLNQPLSILNLADSLLTILRHSDSIFLGL